MRGRRRPPERTDASQAPAPLGVLVAVFEALESEGIRYCNWKSSRRIEEGLAGLTDLDLLVARSDAPRFRGVLARLGLKPITSASDTAIGAVEHYLAWDQDSGRLGHLHVYYRLMIGAERNIHLKDIHLPFEDSLLAGTARRSGVRVPPPELELAILAVRAVAEFRDRDVAWALLPFTGSGMRRSTRAELADLATRVSRDRVEELAQSLRPLPSRLVLACVDAMAKPDPIRVRMLRGPVHRVLRADSRYTRGAMLVSRIRAVVVALISPIVRRFVNHPRGRKSPAAGGIGIAFVGSDGAGKSTAVAATAGWLAWRMNVATYYMGTSQPSVSTRVVRAMATGGAIVEAGIARAFGRQGSVARAARVPSRLLLALRYLAEARERRVRYVASRRDVNRGTIVLYDRYPLPGVRIDGRTMDGPRIASELGTQGFFGNAARVEQRLYAPILPPDHLFVLDVGANAAAGRKPDHRRDRIVAKTEALAAIEAVPGRITLLDANQPLEALLSGVKQATWDLL